MGDPGFVARFRAAERPGCYCRVIREGTIQAGDPVTLEPYAGEPVMVAEVFRDYYEPDPSLADIYRFLAAPLAGALGMPSSGSCAPRCAAKVDVWS